jgi:hypothetical protein
MFRPTRTSFVVSATSAKTNKKKEKKEKNKRKKREKTEAKEKKKSTPLSPLSPEGTKEKDKWKPFKVGGRHFKRCVNNAYSVNAHFSAVTADRIFHTCYMGTVNSSSETRQRAQELAAAVCKTKGGGGAK